MSDKVHIYSTLTSDMEYREYKAGGGDMHVLARSVTIKGGSNLPDPRLITAHGVVTTISAENMDWLKDNEIFQLHQKNGYITVAEVLVDPEKVAADMEGRDESAPLVEADFAPNEQPVVGGVAPEEAPAPKRGGGRRA